MQLKRVAYVTLIDLFLANFLSLRKNKTFLFTIESFLISENQTNKDIIDLFTS